MKNETQANTLESEKNLTEVKQALKKSALGYKTTETKVTKDRFGKPVAKVTTKERPPDPKAAMALAKLQQTEAGKMPPKRNKRIEETEDGRILVSTATLADIMHVSTNTVGTWERQGCPKEKRGWYDIKAVIGWRGREIGVQGGPNTLAQKLTADTRLKEAKAQMAELELKQKSGELIPLPLVEQVIDEKFASLRISMLSIGDLIMAEMYSQYPELAQQARRVIDGHIRKALETIADTGEFRYYAGRPTAKKPVGRPRKTR